jgi:hypothetical protein
MGDLIVVVVILLAFLAISLWESAVEGRNSWDKKKAGWKIKIGKKVILTKYHFFLFYVMVPSFLLVPIIVSGWDRHLIVVIAVAFLLGAVIEDFFWYVFNEKVKLKEFWSSFSDYYPWIKIGGKKILPVFYVVDIVLCILITILFW